MNSDLIARWTTVVTNIAVIVGLIFVGLEFRNTARAIEAERIDDFIAGNAEINSLTVESESLSQLLFKAHTAPDSLTGIDKAVAIDERFLNRLEFNRQNDNQQQLWDIQLQPGMEVLRNSLATLFERNVRIVEGVLIFVVSRNQYLIFDKKSKNYIPLQPNSAQKIWIRREDIG